MGFVHDDIYFAGILDGEGWIGFTSNKGSIAPAVQLRMSHMETVKAFADWYKIKFKEQTNPALIKLQKEKGYKRIYLAAATGHKAYDIVRAIYPYLLTKKTEAEKILAFYENRKCRGCGNPIQVHATKNALYCTPTCRQKHYRGKNKQLIKEINQRYYQKKKGTN